MDRIPGPGPSGYLYLLSNETMPGIVKVGMTRRDPRIRAGELGNPTGVPAPFNRIYFCPVGDPVAAETWIHQRLDERGDHRVNSRREFFRASTTEVISLMMEAAQAFPVRGP